jgi:predicted nucleic acid-binding protein
MTAPGDLTFVDTNVLFYTLDVDAGVRHQQAIRVIADLWETERGVLSTQVLQELYVNATRKLPAVSAADVREAVAEYFAWPVHRIAPEDVITASFIQEQHTVSFRDALIVVAAQRSGATVLLSEDLQDGRQFGSVTVVNPFSALPANGNP